MHYIVSLSGGIASAVAADRAIQRYGTDSVTLWFADTHWEDEDLYRFLADLERHWGKRITIKSNNGRNPLIVAEDNHIIPNQKLAVCSRELKQLPFKAFLAQQPKPVTVLLGLDWRELHRHAAPRKAYTSPGVEVDFPLLWPPVSDNYADIVRGWGIAIPRLYALGFPHNNCGGRCVRQGQKEWLRLRDTFPERFAEVRDWETKQRGTGDNRANYALLRDRTGGTLKALPLVELERRNPALTQAESTDDDRFGCFCDY